MRIVVFGKREEIPLSSHLCQVYSRADEATQLAASLISADPVPYRELCIYIGPKAMAEQIEQLLTKEHPSFLLPLKEADQILFVDDRSAYLARNRFDPYFLLASHLTLINQALNRRLEGVRLVIEMSWLADGVATPAHILKYEAMCDSVFTFQQKPIVVIAQYSAPKIGDQIVGEMMKLHPLAVVGKYLRRNPSYLNSEQYFLNILKLTRKRAAEE
ncbi:MAG: MEDS domain-containing protein [Chloroflexi bacterium]|nr:MEDS domain-containing protein [Chloroflexota bacterium]